MARDHRMNGVLSSCGTRTNATVKEEIHQGRAMIAREWGTSRVDKRKVSAS